MGRVAASLQESVRAELLRVGVQVFPAMDEVIARAQHDARRILAPAGGEVLLGHANDERHDRANPQTLANRGIEVFQLAQLIVRRVVHRPSCDVVRQ